MKLFDNPKWVVAGILLVILLFVAYQAKATEMELGATYAGEFNDGYALSLVERFGSKFDVGVTLIGEQNYKDGVVENNGSVWFGYVAERPKSWVKGLPSEVTIGAAHWVETNRFIGCQQGYMLGLKWLFGSLSVGVRHWSNAGICKPNRGQDVLTFGWRF